MSISSLSDSQLNLEKYDDVGIIFMKTFPLNLNRHGRKQRKKAFPSPWIPLGCIWDVSGTGLLLTNLWSSLCGFLLSSSFWRTWINRSDPDNSWVPAVRPASLSSLRSELTVNGIQPSVPVLLPSNHGEDMADPGLTSPSGTPLRSPNAPLTLSFPFLREGSRVWEERREQPVPHDLPSPLPTKRNRTYSA